jgi:hypothetical protein
MPAADRAAEHAAEVTAERAAAAADHTDGADHAATSAAATSGKRIRWTREVVIAELCEWLISGIVEPAFLRRHGKPGLVTAATRIFGRFDSALNFANLYLAKQYPDGPPARRGPPPAHGRAIARRPALERATAHDAAPVTEAAEATPVQATAGAAVGEPVPGDATIVREAPPSVPRPQ